MRLKHALRNEEAARGIEVIALTGGDLPPAALDAVRGQVDRVLPADEVPPEALLRELRRIAGREGSTPSPRRTQTETVS